MSLLIISASQRHGSQSIKVANFIKEMLLRDFEVQANLLDLASESLPIWTDHPDRKDEQATAWQPISQRCIDAFGFVIVTPEWGGGITPVLKNFFLYCNHQELADKPAYIVSITSGYAGGGYPAAELRLGSFKNTQICYIPEQLILRSITHILNDPEPTSQDDFTARVRLQYGLKLLLSYANCMIPLRHQAIRDFDSFPYGM